MEYREVTKDLFTVPASFALAHCISNDAEMGAGIAKQFVRLNPSMRGHIVNQFPKVGDSVLYINDDGQHIFNLITKDRYFHKPTYRSLEVSLQSMRYQMIKLDIHKIAMPTIGCGLDKLDWNTVSEIVQETFKHDDVKIAICLPPKGFRIKR